MPRRNNRNGAIAAIAETVSETQAQAIASASEQVEAIANASKPSAESGNPQIVDWSDKIREHATGIMTISRKLEMTTAKEVLNQLSSENIPHILRELNDMDVPDEAQARLLKNTLEFLNVVSSKAKPKNEEFKKRSVKLDLANDTTKEGMSYKAMLSLQDHVMRRNSNRKKIALAIA